MSHFSERLMMRYALCVFYSMLPEMAVGQTKPTCDVLKPGSFTVGIIMPDGSFVAKPVDSIGQSASNPTVSLSGGSASISATEGTPSITTNEVSTDQALQLIRLRRDQQEATTTLASVASAQTLPVQDTLPDRAETPVQHLKKVRGKPKGHVTAFIARRKAKTKKASTQSLQFANIYGVAHGPEGQPPQENSAWAQFYGDYERHPNLNPGQLDNPTRIQITEGALGGVDTTFVLPDPFNAESLKFGILSGYNSTRSSFSDTPNTKDAFQKDEGAFAGIYGTYTHNRFSADFLVKGDFYDHEQTQITNEVTTIQCQDGQFMTAAGLAEMKSYTKVYFGQTVYPYGDPSKIIPVSGGTILSNDARTATITTSVRQAGIISEINLNAGSNVYYRLDLGDGFWLEPTAGYRYTYTDYGDGAAALGLENGQLFRILGGARVGTAGIYQGYRYSASLLGLLYDDVSILGYVAEASGLTSGPATVDQGKLRATAQLLGKLEDAHGLEYTLQLEVRGGEDVVGAGGKVGIRYRW